MTRSEFQNVVSQALEELPEEFQQAIENLERHLGRTPWLETIGKGEVMLPSPSTEASTETRDPKISFGTSDTSSADSNRIFSRVSQGAL